MIIKNTKEALPFEQAEISESVTEWGQSRTEFDLNFVVGSIGETKLTMRVLGALQLGNQYWQNTSDHRDVIIPYSSLITGIRPSAWPTTSKTSGLPTKTKA